MKKIIITILVLYLLLNISYANGIENILGMKCEYKKLNIPKGGIKSISNIKFGTSGEDVSFIYDENIFYNSYLNKNKKIPNNFYLYKYTLNGNGNLLKNGNNIIIFNKDNKKFLEYEEIKHFEYDDYDLRNEDSYIFFGKHKNNNKYSLFINGKEKYSFLLDKGIKLEKGILFSNNLEHYIVSYKKDNKYYLIIDGKETEGFTNLGGQPKIFNNGDYTFIAGENNIYKYILNGKTIQQFEANIEEKSIKILNGKYKGKKYFANNFHLEIINNQYYLFGIKFNTNQLEIIKDGKIVKTIDDINSIGLEKLSFDRKKYTLNITYLNKKKSLIIINNGQLILSKLKFDFIHSRTFSKKYNKILYVGRNYIKTNELNSNLEEYLILNDKEFGKYKKIETVGFDKNDNIYFNAINKKGIEINFGEISYKNFISKINTNLSSDKNKVYDIYFGGKKILTSNKKIESNNYYYINNSYILAQKNLNNELVIYKNGKKTILNIGSFIYVYEVGLSPDGKKYYIFIKDRKNKKSILIDNGKIIKLNTDSILVGGFTMNNYIKNFGSYDYNLVYKIFKRDSNNKTLIETFIDGKKIGENIKTFMYKEESKAYDFFDKNLYVRAIDNKSYLFKNGIKSKKGFDGILEGIILKRKKEILNFLAINNDEIKFYSCDLSYFNNLQNKINFLKSNLEFNKLAILAEEKLNKTNKGKIIIKKINYLEKNIFPKISDKKLIEIYKKIDNLDLKNKKNMNFLDLINYLKAKVGLELNKRLGN